MGGCGNRDGRESAWGEFFHTEWRARPYSTAGWSELAAPRRGNMKVVKDTKIMKKTRQVEIGLC
jgi:hypothetical protein